MVKNFIQYLDNGIKLELVYIPGGSFLMGSPEQEEGRSSGEGPQHKVILMPFYMSNYPVTQEQYQVVMSDNPSHVKGKNRPVERVSWRDATKFCRRLSEKTGGKYSLPSESQWEYACRARTTTPFNCGDTINPELANYMDDNKCRKELRGKKWGETTSVGEFPPNDFGLYDMHGNVWEWCADDWHGDYNGAPTDGSVWLNGDTDIRLLRGGSWWNPPRECRSASRVNSYSDGDYDVNIGFRIVSAPPGILHRLLARVSPYNM